MINRSRLFSDNLVAAHARRQVAGKRRHRLAAPMAIMVAKIGHHERRSAGQSDLKRNRNF